MVSIEEIARQVRGEIEAEYEAEYQAEYEGRVRACLARQPRQWLEEQLLAQVLPGTGAAPRARTESEHPAQDGDERAERRGRIRSLNLDEKRLAGLVARFRELDRDRLEAEGFLLHPPPKGSGIVAADQRSAAGQALLRDAKDVLYALVYGDDGTGVRLERVERERLTLTLPSAKAHTIASVLCPAADYGTEDTRHDPAHQVADDRAPDSVIRVAYGEVASELVGNGIAATLRLINHLEVNEQTLYARMESTHESTESTESTSG
jgi:hypothetical protein